MEQFSEINVTPFTDVLLVLLVIFMILAALVVPPGFERRLPARGTSPSGAHNRVVVVSITREGAIAVDGVRTTENGLYDALLRIGTHLRKPPVQILADAHARYGLVIRALDAAKYAQLGDVSFVTQ